MSTSLAELQQAAEEFAKLGGNTTLNYFKKSFQLERKSDQSPVTNADREAESIIREQIRKHFPGHGIIGEEFGTENEDSEVVWVLDPIDGTKSFIHGIPFYTTLIGILVRNKPEVGIIYAPALDEMVSAATGKGCKLNGEKITTRTCTSLAEATFLTTEVDTFDEYGFGDPFRKLLSSTRLHRTWGDAYGHMMVATGRADLMIDPILNLWDAAAILPVVTEAGGRYFDVFGKPSIQTGNAISCSAGIADDVLRIFEKHRNS